MPPFCPCTPQLCREPHLQHSSSWGDSIHCPALRGQSQRKHWQVSGERMDGHQDAHQETPLRSPQPQMQGMALGSSTAIETSRRAPHPHLQAGSGSGTRERWWVPDATGPEVGEFRGSWEQLSCRQGKQQLYPPSHHCVGLRAYGGVGLRTRRVSPGPSAQKLTGMGIMRAR